MTELTNTELALIGLVAEGPKYGYQIEQSVDQRGMREWTEIGFSSIYYALNRLEQSGWLSSQRTESGARPGRRVYNLTEEGRVVYRSEVLWRLSSDRPRTADFDLALANLSALGDAGNAADVDIYKALQERRRRLQEKLIQVETKWQTDGRGHLPVGVEALFSHSLAQLRAELNWMDEFIQNISGDLAGKQE